MKLDHVQLAIPPDSEDLCRAFYCGLLGWAEQRKPDELIARGGLWLSTGETDIHLGVEQSFRPAKKAHPAFLVNDLSTLADGLLAGGYEPQWDDSIPDLHRFFVFDAVGNRLEFIQATDKL